MTQPFATSGAVLTASPLGADFQDLRQGFSPPIPAITSNPTRGIGVRMRKVNCGINFAEMATLHYRSNQRYNHKQ